jgi:hypothetical protein
VNAGLFTATASVLQGKVSEKVIGDEIRIVL